MREGKTLAVSDVLPENQCARRLFQKLVKLIPGATETMSDGLVHYKLPLRLSTDEIAFQHPKIEFGYHELDTRSKVKTAPMDKAPVA